MRIGIDGRLWNESGVGRYTRNLVENLQILDRKNEYVLFVRSKDYSSIKEFVPSATYTIIEVDIRWHTLQEQLQLPSILHKEKLDLVHFPYFSVPIFYTKPFVVTIHDLILHHFPTGEASTLPLPFYEMKLLGYKYIISQAAKRAKKIITVSNATKNEIANHLGVGKDKIVVTYEGIDKKVSSIKYQVSSIKSSYFLYVGNAYPHKNLERLLMAFKGIKNQQSAVKLVLVGKEDYFYKKLQEKVREINLSRNVIFYGEATDEELVGLYKNAKALVMPSLMEGFGLPTLEAMANNCLVLASEIPTFREICSSAAIYFDPYDVEDIEEKMKMAYMGDLKKNIVEGSQRVKMFSWKKMAEETLKIYESCIGI